MKQNTLSSLDVESIRWQVKGWDWVAELWHNFEGSALLQPCDWCTAVVSGMPFSAITTQAAQIYMCSGRENSCGETGIKVHHQSQRVYKCSWVTREPNFLSKSLSHFGTFPKQPSHIVKSICLIVSQPFSARALLMVSVIPWLIPSCCWTWSRV